MEAAPPPLFIGKPRGRIGIQKIPKHPNFMSHIKGIKGIKGRQVELHGGAAPLNVPPTWGAPQRGFLSP